jgi:opacity protein-like surface antigen
MRFSFLVAVLFIFSAQTLLADRPYDSGWQLDNLDSSRSKTTSKSTNFEFVPYVWIGGIKGPLKINRERIRADQDMDKLWDRMDVGGSLVTSYAVDEWIGYMQADYLEVSTRDIDSAPAGTRLYHDSLFLSGYFGKRYNLEGARSRVDAMGGIRYSRLEGELEFANGGFVSGGADNYYDLMLMVRPNFGLNDWLSLNIPLALGAGSSDYTYDAQPQLNFHITDALEARFGYRLLGMKASKGNNSVDAVFHGFLMGMGFQF